jgi:hypothetical protein
MARTSNLCGGLLLALLALPGFAHAQASRSGNTFSLGGTTAPVRDPDVAFNSIDGTYVAVAGNTFIEAHLMNASGAKVGAVRVSGADYAAAPRIAFSPHIPGGGGYLVTWHASLGAFARVRGRIISATGSWLSGEIDIAVNAVDKFSSTNWLKGADVAYSTTSGEFLVTWTGSYNVANDIYFARVSIGGALLPNPGGTFATPVTTTPQDIDWDPSVAYNPDADEFYIAYAGWAAAGYGYASGRRVKAGSGAFVGGHQLLATASAVQIPAVTYNTSAHQYLVGWYHGAAGIYGMVLNGADASPIGGLRVLSGYYFAYDALDIDYNSPSGQYLLVTYGKNWEDAAVTILGNGTAYDNGFVATNTTDVRPLGADLTAEGNFSPRITPSAADKKWLLVTANKFSAVYAQFLGSGAAGLSPCTVTLGGGSSVAAHIDGQTAAISIATATPSGCAWTASSSASWLTLSAAGGSGTGALNWTAAANTTGAPRTASVTVGGQTVSVTQCAAGLVSTSGNGAVGGAGGVPAGVGVTVWGGSCGWTITSSESWITGSNGTGSGLAGYTVAANPSTRARVGRIRLGGHHFTVFQNGGDGVDERIAVGMESFGMLGGWLALHGGGLSEPQGWTRLNWEEYNRTAGGLHPAIGNLDGDAPNEIVLGLARGGGGWLVILDDAASGHAVIGDWLQLPWGPYNAANGELYPAVGDIDGDGRDEIVVGLGRGGGGWFAIYDDTTNDGVTNYTLAAWRRVEWPAYSFGPEASTRPAVGDLDGDGKAEIIIGLGTGGGGWLEIFADADGGYAHQGWTRVNWDAYNMLGDGGVWPAAGDVDGDGNDEIVIGLGRGGAGWVEVKDGAAAPLVTRRWLRVNWAGFNLTDGVTHPAVGNIDGDGSEEIVLGLGNLGAGWLQIFDDFDGTTFPSRGFTRVALPEFHGAGRGTFPAVGILR